MTWRQLFAAAMTSDVDLDADAEIWIDDKRTAVVVGAGRSRVGDRKVFTMTTNKPLFTRTDVGRAENRGFVEGHTAGGKEERDKQVAANTLNLKGGRS